MLNRSTLVPVAVLFAVPAVAVADPKSPTFDQDVLPILKQHCVGCHGNDKQRGGLNAASFAAVMQGGASGEVVKPGDPDKSRLFTLTAHKDEPKMPPKADRIPDAQIETLRLWVEQGARENAGSKVVAAKPKTEIGLKSVVKGRPEGPPPMPLPGKLPQDPPVRGRRAGAVLALAASPWAPLVAVGGQKQVLLYHADSGDLLGVLPFEHGQVNAVKFSRNGRLLLAAGGRGGQSGKAVLYAIETGAKVTEVGQESDAILAADLSADQTQIAVGGPSKIVRIYATADGAVVREIKKHTDWVTAVEFSPDGVLLATGDRNGGLFVWEGFTGREYFSLRGHTAMVTDLSWRDDSNVLASGSLDTTVRLWEMENGNQIKAWGAHGGGVESVRYAHDNRLASTGRDRVTKLWDQNGGVQKQFEAFPDLGLRVAVTHDNARVIAGDWAGHVKGWAAADAKALLALDANPPAAADRLRLAEQAVAAATAKLQQATAAAAAAKAAADKAAAEIAGVQKAVTDAAAVASAARTAVEPAKAAADKAAAATAAAQAAAAARAVTQQALAEAAAKVQDAATKAPQNGELKAQAARVAELARAAANEAAQAAAAAATAQAAQQQAAARVAATQKAAGDAASAQTAAQQRLAAETAARKPVFDAHAAAQAAVAAATAELAAAKAKADKLRPAAPAAAAKR
jgi:hypothetical protein